MLKKLLLLVALLALWVALLWFAIGIDLSKHGNVSLVAMHLLPPLALWASWLGWRAWQTRKQAADTAAEAEAKRAALDKHRAESRKKFDQDLAERRAGVDFRWLQVRDLSKQENTESLAMTTDEMTVTLLDEEMSEIADETPDAWPGVQLTELFAALLAQCPAALTFPVYLLGPSSRAFADQSRMVCAARESALSQLETAWPQNIALGAVLGLPRSNASPQELIDLCATQPELPGALVLAFESPLSNAQHGEEEPNPETKQREQWFGKAGQALVGMLLTAPALPSVLAQLGEIAPDGAHDVMTPFWERTQLAPGMISALAPLPADWRQTLADMPMIAQLRRPAWIEVEEKARPTQITQSLRRILEVAGINAALIEPQFDFDGDASEAPKKAPPIQMSDSRWLVHNAGSIDACGSRIGGIGLALSGAGMDLDAVGEGLNVVAQAGDCGRATPYLMLALAAIKTAELRKPTLVTFFQGGQVGMSFVRPASV